MGAHIIIFYFILIVAPIMLVVKVTVEGIVLGRWFKLPKRSGFDESLSQTFVFILVLIFLNWLVNAVERFELLWVEEIVQSVVAITMPTELSLFRLPISLITFWLLHVGTTLGYWKWKNTHMPLGNWKTAILLYGISTIALGGVHLLFRAWLTP
ncbi:MAG: hypothetical protein AAF614_03710 [Chloroflexota bacterium]